MVKIECVKGINSDYYHVIGDRRIGTSYTVDAADILVKRLRENNISEYEIIRGRNVFAGRPLTDNEFLDMKRRVIW